MRYIYQVGAAFLYLVSVSVFAASPQLAQSPLFSTNAVPPNIFFEIDDSGSMAWNILAVDHYKSCDYNSNNTVFGGNWDCILNGGGQVFDKMTDSYMIMGSSLYVNNDAFITGNGCNGSSNCNDPNAGDWRFWSSDFNVTYYNPLTSDYLPWTGSGLPNASFTAARRNPQPGTIEYNSTKNLDSFVYAKWTDGYSYSGARPHRGSNLNRTTGSDGLIDWWDDYTLYVARSPNGGSIEAYDLHYRTKTSGGMALQVKMPAGGWKNLNKADYRDLIRGKRSRVTPTRRMTGSASFPELNNRTVTQSLTNIANWYSYARDRKMVTKGGVSSVIRNNPTFRYGLSVINQPNKLFSQIPNGLVGFAAHNGTLLTDFYNYEWGNPATPLRKGLDFVGRYYEGLLTANKPIDYACQQNFTILLTDGYWNQLAPSGVGDNDADGITATLADVSKKYYDKDLSTLPNQVPTNAFDKSVQQHMNTFTVGFGVKGALTDPDNDGWPGLGNAYTASSNWGNPLPLANSAEKVDDLWHAAFNGHGGYYNAKNPKQLLGALTSSVNNIAARVGSASTVAFNTATLTSNSAVYLAQFSFFNAMWSGDLQAFALDPLTGTVSAVTDWSAAKQLDLMPSAQREIITANNHVGAPFTWNKVSLAMKNDLRTAPSGLQDTVLSGQNRLQFLRGDRTLEGSTFRTRSHVLGDIIHSDPIYVGKPSLYWFDHYPFPSGVGQTYTDYKNANANRTSMIYAGANDGFLHGFDAVSGKEVFAFAPESLASSSITKGYHYLTDKAYGHRFYVDLPSTLSDVYLDLGKGVRWQTILIGGERAGGRGLFALDVSSPTLLNQAQANAKDIFLWSFTSKDEPNLGATYSRPSISLMNNGRWAAIVGNGYNNNGDGKAKLLILFLDGGTDGVWTKGVDYIELDTGVGTLVNGNCQDAASQCNGLSSPQSVDLDKDLIVDRIYAGDLQGNLWAFDVSSADASKWGSAYNNGGATPKPLFSAGPNHQILDKPIAALREGSVGAGKDSPDYMVFFGTGSYLSQSDISNTTVEAFYGVWDHGQSSITPNQLVQQVYINNASAPQFRLVSNKPVTYGTGTQGQGWRIDLTKSVGERIIVDPQIRDGLVFFNTWIPDTNACNAGGTGYLMTVQQKNGGAPKPKPAFDSNGNGVINSSDVIFYTDPTTGTQISTPPAGQHFTQGLPSSSGVLGNYQYTPGTRGGTAIAMRTIAKVTTHNNQRVAWREIKAQ